MLAYVARRIASAIPTLAILAALTFFLLRLAPGGPFDSDRVWPAEIQANILRKYELDRPMPVQFAHWARDVARGDLRESFQYIGRPVTEIIAQSLPSSLLLGGLALLIALLGGSLLGALAAQARGRPERRWIDSCAVFVAASGVSLPPYLLAGSLVLIFSLWLGWLPPALWEEPASLVLPVLALAARPLAIIAQLTRESMIEALRSDYVRTAISKGVPERAVVFRHALRNSLIPLLTLLGPIAANLLTGSFLVETVFEIPGLGKHFVAAILNRDYPLVMGVTLVYGIILIGANLTVDLLCAWADPRIRLDGGVGAKA